MKPLILFGNGLLAELAHFYFSHDSERKIAAFCLDSSYIKEDRFMELPVVPFEGIENIFPPDAYDMFIAIGYNQMNKARKEKYIQAKAKGYALVTYISTKATVLSTSIGDNCMIPEGNIIQPYVRIGNNVLMFMNNGIGHHSILEDHCTVTSHVIIGGKVQVKEGCFIGMNATLRDSIIIEPYCLVGAGALILDNTQAEGAYKGAAASLLPKNSFEFL